MSKLDMLRVQKQGFPKFAIKVADKIKEVYEDIYEDIMNSEPLLKEAIVELFNLQNSRLRYITNEGVLSFSKPANIDSVAIKKGKITVFIGYVWSLTPISIDSLFIVTDLSEYSNYLINIREQALEKQIKEEKEEIEKIRNNYSDRIRLGLELNDTYNHSLITELELFRGKQVSKEEATEFLTKRKSI